jgi:hypothetical protein
MTNPIKLNVSCVYTIPNENLHKVMGFVVEFKPPILVVSQLNHGNPNKKHIKNLGYILKFSLYKAHSRQRKGGGRTNKRW